MTSVDTAKKTISYKIHHFILHDKEFNLSPRDAMLDVHVAQIRRDSIDVPLSVVKAGDSITAVSYADAFKNLLPHNGERAEPLLARLPAPEPVDEVYLKRRPEERRADIPPTKPKAEEPFNMKKAAIIALISAGSLIVLIFLLPLLVLIYFNTRSKGAKPGERKAYWTYRAASYYLHQLGFARYQRTPMQYAREVIDPALGTALSAFMNSYLKVKYAKRSLAQAETEQVSGFLQPFYAQVKSRVPARQRLSGFLNPARMISFFVRTAENDGG